MQQLLLAAKKSTGFVSSTTWNPNDAGAGVTLSNGNLTTTMVSGYAVRGSVGHSDGKWVFETTYTQLDNGATPVYGLGTSQSPLSFPWNGPGELLIYNTSSIYGSNIRGTYGVQPVVGDVISCAVDFSARTVTFYRNGVSMGVAFNNVQFLAGTTYYPFISSPANTKTAIATTNFGKTPLQYPIAGYTSGW